MAKGLLSEIHLSLLTIHQQYIKCKLDGTLYKSLIEILIGKTRVILWFLRILSFYDLLHYLYRLYLNVIKLPYMGFHPLNVSIVNH